MDANLDSWMMREFEMTRIDVGDENLSRFAHAFREPARDGASASSHLEAVPSGADAECREVAFSSCVEGIRERRKTSDCFRGCVVERVGPR
jgi:hypothetical protein